MKTMNKLEEQYEHCLDETTTDIEDIIAWEQGNVYGFGSSCYMFYAWMIEDLYGFQN